MSPHAVPPHLKYRSPKKPVEVKELFIPVNVDE